MWCMYNLACTVTVCRLIQTSNLSKTLKPYSRHSNVMGLYLFLSDLSFDCVEQIVFLICCQTLLKKCLDLYLQTFKHQYIQCNYAASVRMDPIFLWAYDMASFYSRINAACDVVWGLIRSGLALHDSCHM